jgi:hypothetical protein
MNQLGENQELSVAKVFGDSAAQSLADAIKASQTLRLYENLSEADRTESEKPRIGLTVAMRAHVKSGVMLGVAIAEVRQSRAESN